MVGVAMENIYERAHTTPASTALRADGVTVNYRRFARGIEAMRQAMAGHGLPAGSTAIVAIRRLLDGWTTVLALRSLGLHTVAVSDLDEALAFGLEHVSCVVTDPHKGGQTRFMADHWPRARLIRVPAAIYDSLADGPAPALPETSTPPGSHLLYTSGTTGTYKMLVQDGAHEAERCALRAESYGLTNASMWYVGYLGMWTAVGYKMPLAVWQAGGGVVFDQRSNWALEFMRQPCDALLTPEMVAALESVWPADAAPGDWHLHVTAGFLPVSRARRVLANLTRTLSVSYGSTELCIPALQTDVVDVEEMHWLKPASDRDVEIVDDRGQVCGCGEEGQLRVRLTSCDADGYLGDAEASRKTFRAGYFYPGDMAVRRADGCIRVLGRSADVLNLQGRKVALAPVEQTIQEWLGVSAVCIFSGINADGEDEVVVALETDRQPSQELIEGLRRELAGFERFRLVLSAEFPRTTTGTSKVNRKALRRRLFPSEQVASDGEK